MMVGSPPKQHCFRGHDMSLTRKRNPSGRSYCSLCKTNYSKKKYDARTPEQHRNRNLKKRYGLSSEQYNVLLEQCNGQCNICKKKDVKLCVDHDHNTNNIRGLLCNNCNRALGFFKDDIENLKRAMDYLNKEQTSDPNAFNARRYS